MMQGWLRPKNAAEYCNVSTRTIHEWMKLGLRHSKMRGAVLIKVEWIDEFLEQREQKSDADTIVDEVVKDIRKRG